MSDCKEFIEFCNKVGDDLSSSILDTICELKECQSRDNVHLTDVHRHDAINHVLSGTVDVGNEVYGFVVESGNNRGTVVLQWGLEDDIQPYVPDAPVSYTFTVKNIELKNPEQKAVILNKYNILKETPDFKEKVRAYNYDRHFAPGVVTDKHYTEWADKHGLVITPIDND